MVHTVTRAVLSAIPKWGGPAAVFFESTFPGPSERRTEAAIELLTSGLDELKNRPGVDFDALRDSDDFREYVHDVLRAAITTHRREKLDALRNALVNAALSPTAGEAKGRVFLRFIDELDVPHLLLLRLMASPATFLRQQGLSLPGPGDRIIEIDAMTLHESPRSLSSIVNSLFGHVLPGDLRDIILQDLVRRRLTSTDTFSVLCVPGKSFASALGEEFVRFIDNPREPQTATA